jgi:hypothetical protein
MIGGLSPSPMTVRWRAGSRVASRSIGAAQCASSAGVVTRMRNGLESRGAAMESMTLATSLARDCRR